MTKIGIILGSTRPNRNGEQVAKWVLDMSAKARGERQAEGGGTFSRGGATAPVARPSSKNRTPSPS